MKLSPIPLPLRKSQSDFIVSLKCVGKLLLASLKPEISSNYYLNFPSFDTVLTARTCIKCRISCLLCFHCVHTTCKKHFSCLRLKCVFLFAFVGNQLLLTISLNTEISFC